ncbi:MAG: hypothetical protein ACLFR6_08510 [Salinarchaeum sp.]
MSQHTLDAFDQPEFNPGDRVVDTDPIDPDDTPDEMVILDRDIGTAATVTVDGETVAELNPSYPADERVVETAYISYLDSYIPPWREWAPAELRDRLEAFCRQWGVRQATYSYPEGRLQRVTGP